MSETHEYSIAEEKLRLLLAIAAELLQIVPVCIQDATLTRPLDSPP